MLGLGLVLLAIREMAAVPRDTSIEIPLGDDHARITQLDIGYVQEGELVHRSTLRYPDGAPERVRHTVELSPGTYELDVTLRRDDGTGDNRVATVEAPGEGTIRVALRSPDTGHE